MITFNNNNNNDHNNPFFLAGQKLALFIFPPCLISLWIVLTWSPLTGALIQSVHIKENEDSEGHVLRGLSFFCLVLFFWFLFFL